MNHEDNAKTPASRGSRGPKGFGEHAARALEQSLGAGPGWGALEEEPFLKEWLSGQGRLIRESYWLGKFFGQSPEFWFRVRSNCDFRLLRKKERMLTAKVKPLAQLQAA